MFHRIARRPAVIVACGALAAGGGAVLLAPIAGANTPASTATTTTASTGTGTISVTGPRGRTRTHSGAVRCRVRGQRYVVRSRARHARHDRVLRLVVRHYTGPGSYRGVVVLIRRHGNTIRGHVFRQVPVTITATGGSFSYSKTLSGKRRHALAGKTVSVKASWTCTA